MARTEWQTTRSETLGVPYTDQLRQGDIIRLEWNQPSEDAHQLGVIINADCDLAHGKVDGVLAYLPIYSVAEYIDQFYFPDIYAPQKLTEIESSLKGSMGLSKEEFSSLIELIEQEGGEAALSTLDSFDIKKASSIQKCGISIQQLAVLIGPGRGFEKLCQIAQLKDGDGTALRKELLNAVDDKALGSSHLFISDIHSHDLAGFVVRLRRIFSFPANHVDKTSLPSDGPHRRVWRIARLSDLYRFRLAQQFAAQFSRIGLPDEISELKPLAIEMLMKELDV